MRPLCLTTVCTALLLSTSTVHAATWSPPIGIPAPSFGIENIAPAVPNPWTTATAGFYYIDATKTGATDSGNPYGTPAKPRLSIPTILPAGAVVELHGTYDVAHSSPRTIVSEGTSARPVFIRGVSSTSRPLARRGWEVRGTYLIVENIEFGPTPDLSTTGGMVIRLPASHVAVRNSDLHGTPNDGGLGIVNWEVPYGVPYTGTGVVDHVVIYNNTIHDNGDLSATFDQDIHGISVSDHVNNIWIVDNQIYRNSGDGIQINAQAGQRATTHHIYIGRNVARDNKQTGFWVKESTDVILSQNRTYGHRPGNSSLGQCMGAQYTADWVWFLYNNVHDCEYGIQRVSDNTTTMTSHTFVVGNLIHAIHHTQPSNPDSGWGPSAVMIAGGTETHVVNNTIYDVDSGVNIATPNTTLNIAGNIIANITMAQASHMLLDFRSLAAQTTFTRNLLFGDARLDWGNGPTRPTASELTAWKSLVVDPQFVNTAASDFHLKSTSPALGAGDVNGVYATFQQRYGVSIAADIEGTPRPAAVYAMGAYEKPCAAAAPGAPLNLTGSNTASAISLQWAAPLAGCSAAPSNYRLEIGSTPGSNNLANLVVGAVTTVAIPATSVPAGSYYFRVRAQNAIGTGPASNELTLRYGAPGAPGGLTLSTASSRLTLSWTAPTGGGSVAGYILEVGSVSASANGGSFALPASSTTLSTALPPRGTCTSCASGRRTAPEPARRATKSGWSYRSRETETSERHQRAQHHEIAGGHVRDEHERARLRRPASPGRIRMRAHRQRPSDQNLGLGEL